MDEIWSSSRHKGSVADTVKMLLAPRCDGIQYQKRQVNCKRCTLNSSALLTENCEHLSVVYYQTCSLAVSTNRTVQVLILPRLIPCTPKAAKTRRRRSRK